MNKKQQKAERITDLLRQARTEMVDAKAANGYPCFSMPALQTLNILRKELRKVFRSKVDIRKPKK